MTPRPEPLSDTRLAQIRAHVEALRLDALALDWGAAEDDGDITYAAYAAAYDDLSALLAEVERQRDELTRRMCHARRAKRAGGVA